MLLETLSIGIILDDRNMFRVQATSQSTSTQYWIFLRFYSYHIAAFSFTNFLDVKSKFQKMLGGVRVKSPRDSSPCVCKTHRHANLTLSWLTVPQEAAKHLAKIRA